MVLDAGSQRNMLRQMVLVRAFEEKLEELYQRKAMFGSTHPIAARRRLRSECARRCGRKI